MGFEFKRSLRGNASPVLVRVVIDNSDTITLGDLVRTYNAGNAEVAVAARPLGGVVHDVQDSNGARPTPDAGTTDTFTVAADNETVAQIAVLIDMDEKSIYSGASDATPGTTNSSDKIGASFDIASEAEIDESTASRAAQGQLYGWGSDPDDSSRILVSIMESERLPGGTYA